MNCEAMFCHLNMYSNSGKLWSKGSSNFNIAKNSFIYAFTAIKITTAILNTYAENVFYFKVCGCGKTQRNFVCSDIYPTLSFHVQLHWCKKGPYYRYLFDVLGPYLYFRVLIFSVLASFTRRMSIQSACIQQWVNLIYLWWVISCTVIIHNVVKWCFTRYTVNRCFGSLFWLLGVLIGYLFHKKFVPISKLGGPY